MLCCLAGHSHATTISLSPDHPLLFPGTVLLELKAAPETTLTDVLQTPLDAWQTLGHRAITRQHTRDTFWYRFSIHNHDGDSQWFFELDWPMLDEIDVYLVTPEGEMLKHWKTGDRLPFAERPIAASSFIFPLPMDVPRYELLFRLKTSSQFYAMPSVFRETHTVDGAHYYLSHRNTSLFRHSLFFGVMCIMILYNLFVLVETRERSYLAYVAYCTAVTLFHLTLQGWGYQYLWPTSPYLQEVAFAFTATLSYLGALWFIMLFLDIETMPAWNRVGRYLITVWSFFLYLSLVQDEHSFTTGTLPLVILCLMLSAIIPVMAYRRGNTQGLFFLVAWSIPVIGTAANLLMQTGYVEANEFTVFGGQALGIALETVLISLALSYRMKRLQLDEENARSETIRYETQHSVMLAERMRARKQDIERTRDAFNEATKRLSSSDKDAVLGLLVGAVSRQLTPPARAMKDQVAALTQRQSAFNQWLDSLLDGADEDIRKTFSEALQDLDETNSMLITGEARIREVATSLDIEDYFCSQRSEVTPTEMTERMLADMRVRFPDITLDVTCQPDTVLKCWEKALSAAIEAVVLNACQSITTGSGSVTLGIEAQGKEVFITVKDSGSGIPRGSIDRMFDPFYTTREVGGGKGMGLTVAREIVRRHGGRLECQHSDAQGTTMLLRIPS